MSIVGLKRGVKFKYPPVRWNLNALQWCAYELIRVEFDMYLVFFVISTGREESAIYVALP